MNTTDSFGSFQAFFKVTWMIGGFQHIPHGFFSIGGLNPENAAASMFCF